MFNVEVMKKILLCEYLSYYYEVWIFFKYNLISYIPYSMVTNKTDALWSQRSANHQWLFENRMGTRRFSTIFSCVVTSRTGDGRRLYMITSADARPCTVRRPVGVVRDRPRTTQCTADFTLKKHIFTAIMYISRSSFVIMPPNKQVVKNRKTTSDFDSGFIKTDHFIISSSHLFVASNLTIRSTSSAINIFAFIFYIHGLQKYFWNCMSLFDRWQFDLKHTGISRFFEGFSKASCAFQTSCDTPPEIGGLKKTVLCPTDAENTIRAQWNFKYM